MVRRVAGALAAASLMLLAACSSASGSATAGGGSGALRVVASTDVYGDIVQEIAGEKVQVTPIISDPADDPHSYEATTQNQLELSKADIVIENGGGYDDFVDTMLKSAHSPKARVLNVVDLSGKTAPAGGELNEHLWYDYPTMQKLSDQLVNALSAADVADAATFRAGGDAFKQKLQQLEGTEASIKQAHVGQGVAITEPVPLYALQACGLVNKTPEDFSAAIEEGTDVPAPVLRQTLDLFSNKEVRLLAYNEQTSSPETERLLAAAKSNGIPVVPVTETLPGGKDYVGWMSGTLSAIQNALG